MVEIPIPLSDAVSRGKKIADSSAMTWIYRGSMIVACGMIVYFSKGTYETVQSHDQQITHISDTTDTLKNDLKTVKDQVGGDHDWITVLKVEVEGPNGLIVQMGKFWQRQTTGKPP